MSIEPLQSLENEIFLTEEHLVKLKVKYGEMVLASGCGSQSGVCQCKELKQENQKMRQYIAKMKELFLIKEQEITELYSIIDQLSIVIEEHKKLTGHSQPQKPDQKNVTQQIKQQPEKTKQKEVTLTDQNFKQTQLTEARLLQQQQQLKLSGYTVIRLDQTQNSKIERTPLDQSKLDKSAVSASRAAHRPQEKSYTLTELKNKNDCQLLVTPQMNQQMSMSQELSHLVNMKLKASEQRTPPPQIYDQKPEIQEEAVQMKTDRNLSACADLVNQSGLGVF